MTYRVSVSERATSELVMREIFETKVEADRYYDSLTAGGNASAETLLTAFADGVFIDLEELHQGTGEWVLMTRRFGIPGN